MCASNKKFTNGVILKLDIDGVLRDMETPMVDLYNKEFGTNLTKDDIFDYDLSKSFPLLGKNAFSFFFEKHAKETIEDALPYCGVCSAIEKLKNNNIKIVIVSYQPNNHSKIATLEWLEKNKIYYDNIVFTNEPTKSLVACDVIIDDCPKYLDEVDESTIKICINHEYNKYWKPKNSFTGINVDTLESAVDVLLMNIKFWVEYGYLN